MLTRPGFVRAAPTLPGTTWIRLPSTPSTCCDRQKAKVSHLRSNQQRLTAQTEHLTRPRILKAAGLITPEPKKKPKAAYRSFAAELPNQMWQVDFTHYRLTRPDGTPGADVEILCFLDDHSRYALSVTCHQRVTGPVVVAVFRQTVADQGIPASVLSDNGMVFTTRFAGGRAGRDTINGFQAELRDLGVVQKHSRPNHPTTCGKVERFHQTLKKWLTAQPQQPQTVAELQTLCNTFIAYYNNSRPHRSLNRRTPLAAYQARPKAVPQVSAEAEPQPRVRHDVLDTSGKLSLRHNGRLHHIGVGRTHARTPILMLINGLQIRIIHTTTGEIIRELTLNPAVDYQARSVRNPPTKPS